MNKNYQQLLTWLLTTLMLWATATTKAATAEWTDVTSRFIVNTDFNSGNYNGWTVESNAGQRSVSASVMRFWNGTFHLYQTLSNLPQGKYRLTVQGFYRASGDSYSQYVNGTENITAFLYAGTTSTKLKSVYSEWMTSNAGNRQEHDGHYYPDNSTSASAAMQEGCYKGNTVEFQAGGTVTIGIRCQQAESNNYCAVDNFKLEFYGET